MNIEQFYDADERRRSSDEVELGREWSDEKGGRCEVSWVADTGEVYVMAEPVEAVEMDIFGDTRVDEVPTELLTVEVLGVVTSREEIDRRFEGWEKAMRGRNSLQWVRDRLAASSPTESTS
jgi:hypothetical protein